MAAKTSWHRCGTKLRHCHQMTGVANCSSANRRLSAFRAWEITDTLKHDASYVYTWGDSDVILFHISASWFLPPSCRQKLREMFVTAIALKYTSLVNQWSRGHFLKLNRFYLNNTIILRHLTERIMSCYTHKMAIVSWPQTLWLCQFTLCIFGCKRRIDVQIKYCRVRVSVGVAW